MIIKGENHSHNLHELIEGKNGKLSHKRIISVGCFVVAALIAFTTENLGICSLFVGGFIGSGVSSTIEK